VKTVECGLLGRYEMSETLGLSGLCSLTLLSIAIDQSRTRASANRLISSVRIMFTSNSHDFMSNVRASLSSYFTIISSSAQVHAHLLQTFSLLFFLHTVDHFIEHVIHRTFCVYLCTTQSYAR